MASAKFTYQMRSGRAVVTGVEGLAPAYLAVPAVVDGLQVSKVGEGAFEGNLFISSLKIAHGIESIGSGAFRGCPSLKSVRLPASLESVGSGAFGDCPALRTVFLEGTCVPRGLVLGNGVTLRAPNLENDSPSSGEGSSFENAAGFERAIGALRQAVNTGCRVRDKAAIWQIHHAPLDILEWVMFDIQAVKVLVRAVEDMPDIGNRFETLTAMAAACSDAGLPEQATIILAAANQQSGVGKLNAREDPSWLML